MIDGYICNKCHKGIYTHIIPSDGICQECRKIMNEPEQFEGGEFYIVTKIDGNTWFSRRIITTTNYEGYKRVVDLLEELNPSKQSTD